MTTEPRAGAASKVNVEEEEAPRGLTTLGRPRAGLMIEERSRLNDPCPRMLGSPWIGPRFAVESKGPPRYRLPKTPAVGVGTPISASVNRRTEARKAPGKAENASLTHRVSLRVRTIRKMILEGMSRRESSLCAIILRGVSRSAWRSLITRLASLKHAYLREP